MNPLLFIGIGMATFQLLRGEGPSRPGMGIALLFLAVGALAG